MSVAPSTDPFRPDRPGEIEASRRNLASALAHAAAGYPVVPVRSDCKGVLLDGVRRGWTDPRIIEWWWSRRPSSNVGIVLDEANVGCLDIDGPQGEESLLTLLAQAGLEALPMTYEVRTGRGRHLYFRNPCPDLLSTTQYSHQHRRPELDIKVTWMLVAAGSRHKTGVLYTGSKSVLPRAHELPALPGPVIEVLLDRVRARQARAAARGPAAPLGELPSGAPIVYARESSLGRRLWDTSDGRDRRIFSIALRMLSEGRAPEDVIATILMSPLGGKAREQSDPMAYLRRKVVDANEYAGEDDPAWDRHDYQASMLGAGLTDRDARVLTAMSRFAQGAVVSMSTVRIALASATSEGGAREALKRARQQGWLDVISDYDPQTMTPRTHLLTIPANCSESQGEITAPTTGTLTSSPSDLSSLTSHDAFRPRQSSRVGVETLDGCYRLVALLWGGQTMTTREMSERAAMPVSTMTRLVTRLRTHGVINTENRRHVLVTDSAPRLTRILDGVARDCGTWGTRAAQALQASIAAEEHRRYRRAMGTVGTPEWRKAQLPHHIEAWLHPALRPSLELLGGPQHVERLAQEGLNALLRIREDTLRVLAEYDSVEACPDVA